MTEEQWTSRANPIRMVEYLKSAATGRKLRLFATACIRLFGQYLDGVPTLLLDTFEEYADERAEYDEIVALKESLERLTSSAFSSSPAQVVWDMLINLTQQERYRPNAYWLAREVVSEVGRVEIYAQANSECNDEMRRSVSRAAVVVRDIFGNPFRPVTFAPEWRADTALAIARGMYESRDFSAMPILADALQDAGCDSADILDHCRGPGPHVRGCWVVDLVLGKE